MKLFFTEDDFTVGDKFVKRNKGYTEYAIYLGKGKLHIHGLADDWGKGWENKQSIGMLWDFVESPGVEYVGNIYRK